MSRILELIANVEKEVDIGKHRTLTREPDNEQSTANFEQAKEKCTLTMLVKKQTILWETIIKSVPLSRLVWAYCKQLKGYLPGRVANPSEGATERHVPCHIPKDQELIEFFSHPREKPIIKRLVLVSKGDVRPYNRPFPLASDEFKMQPQPSKNWDPSHMIMLDVSIKMITTYFCTTYSFFEHYAHEIFRISSASNLRTK